MVGIIDDREDVWNYAPNLVHVKPYRFFQGTADINAPPGLTKSEHDKEPIAHKVVDHSGEAEKKEGEESSKSGEGEKEVAEAEKSGSSSADVAGSNAVDVTSGSAETESDKCVEKVGESVEVSLETQVSDAATESLETASIPAPMDEQECGDISEEVQKSASDEKSNEEDVKAPEKEGMGEDKDKTNCEKNEDSVDPTKKDSEDSDSPSKASTKDEEELEWEDEDDYLLHLQEILTRVHKAFYEMYEQSQQNTSRELPDLKNIIPYVRKKVLKGANIVFSGMFPLNMAAEKSRAFMVAKALGANVQSDIVVRKSKSGSDPNATTHLVAAKAGTGKHKTALKVKDIRVVSGDWLWGCNERWEWVSEMLFPLVSKDKSGKDADSPESGTPRPSKGKNNRKRRIEKDSGDVGDVEDDEIAADEKSTLSSPAAGKHLKLDSQKQKAGGSEKKHSSRGSKSSGEPQTFANSYNPLFSFSDEDIEFMDKEVDEIMDEDGDSSETDTEREDRVRKEVLGKGRESDSDSESLSGDFPRGWKLRRKSFSPQHKDEPEEVEKRTDAEDDSETENELERYEKNMAAFAPADSDSDSKDDDSIGSVDDEIADAVEKEFLSSL